jgi:hypothetical protein
MGAGRLFVLLRRADRAWALVAAAVDAPEAQQTVSDELAANPRARLVIANGIRSFTAGVQTAEDPQVVIDP